MNDGRTPDDERGWDRGFEGHTRAQRRRLAELPLTVKLAWLEEAQRLAEQLAEARRSIRRASGNDDSARE